MEDQKTQLNLPRKKRLTARNVQLQAERRKVWIGMTLREICETLEVSRRAVQGYEKAGLVSATDRNKYGHLLYDEAAVLRIARIKFYQQLGFSIKEIIDIIDAPNVRVKEALEIQVQKLKKEKAEISELIEKANQVIADL